MLCLLQILERVGACCVCYLYLRWLRPAVLATENRVGPSVLATDIRSS